VGLKGTCGRAIVVASAVLGALPAGFAQSAGLTVTIAARTIQPGELVVLSVSAPSTTQSLRVRVFDRPITAFKAEEGVWRALVGIDLEQRPGHYVALIDANGPSGPLHLETGLDVQPRTFPTRKLQVPPGFVNPPPDALARIRKDTAFLRDVYGHSSSDRLWSEPFVRPVPGEANSRFGTRSVFNGVPRSPHAGTDFLSPAGTPIKAPNAGRIVAARDLYFLGETVIIDHGLGMLSVLGHLSRIDVEEGMTVAPGTQLGLVGATGRVTGAHLHWALSVAGARVDPLSALELLAK